MTENHRLSHVKIAFEVECDPDSVEIETMWAIPTAGGYQLDNIPFYAYDVAYGDIVSAEAEEENGLLFFVDLVHPSGNSCVRLWFEDTDKVQSVRNKLRGMGCDSELNGTRLVAVDVPRAVDYGSIRAYLVELETSGIVDYEESCLAEGHATKK